MPRNGSGVYSLPTGTDDFVPNTTIESSKMDALTADLEADANAARPVVAGGTGAATAVGGADNLSTADSIASQTTTNLATVTGVVVTVTGTDTITAFGTVQAGGVRTLIFAAALTLTHNASSLILPTGANITTAAGDIAVMLSLGSGNWRCIGYTRADGTALAAGGGSGYADGTGLNDDSGNEQLTLNKTASAVNEFAMTNAATGGVPKLSVEGDDTNIGMELEPKGTGVIEINAPKLTMGSDATGDIFYRNASGNVERLAVGSDDEVLTLASGVPTWAGGSADTPGAVGSYAMLREAGTGISTERTIGDTLAGSSLRYTVVSIDNATANQAANGTPSGTWQLMGAYSSNISYRDDPQGIWQRTA